MTPRSMPPPISARDFWRATLAALLAYGLLIAATGAFADLPPRGDAGAVAHQQDSIDFPEGKRGHGQAVIDGRSLLALKRLNPGGRVIVWVPLPRGLKATAPGQPGSGAAVVLKIQAGRAYNDLLIVLCFLFGSRPAFLGCSLGLRPAFVGSSLSLSLRAQLRATLRSSPPARYQR